MKDHSTLKQALIMMKNVADFINEEKKKFENRQKPHEIYQLLRIDREVPATRAFVYEGD